MENSVRERIGLLKDQLGWTENSLANGDLATQKRLNRQLSHGASITLDTVLLILTTFSEISAEWMLRGEGVMLKTESSNRDAEKTIYRLSIENTKLKERIEELQSKLAAPRAVVG